MGFRPWPTFDTLVWPAANLTGEFQVKDFLDHCSTRSGMKYLVKWLGNLVVKATKEPLSHLTNCPAILSIYEECKGLCPTQRGGSCKFLHVACMFFSATFVSVNFWLKMLS